MSECDGELHGEYLRVMWAEAYGASGVLDRGLRFAAKCFQQRAGEPCPCEVRIEHKGSFDVGGGAVEVADDEHKRSPGRTKSHRVVPAQFSCSSPQPYSLRDLMRAIGNPAT